MRDAWTEHNGGCIGADAGAESGAPEFPWPLRCRVISGFANSDGIDIAVPDGTAVHAAENGIVAYAGSGLTLRQPDPDSPRNGHVTAYAHASELMVKRNDTVRRGQVIAKSGQSGSVSSPQPHFETRKKSRPVDPRQFVPAS